MSPWALYTNSSDFILDQFVYVSEVGVCIPTFTNPKNKVLVMLTCLTWVMLPFIVITCSYLWLGLVARQQSRRIADSSNTETSKELRRKEWKGVKIAFWITASFFLAWCPILFICFLEVVLLFQVSMKIKLAAVFFATFSSWNNVVLYFLIYKEFRQTGIRILVKGYNYWLSCFKKLF